MNIKIIKQGIADSIQDTGRYGFQHLGINPGGAMDKLATQTANLLVGNNPKDAVIEIHFPASVFLFNSDAVIAMSGADFSALINNQPVPINTPLIVAKNSSLQFKSVSHGARIYLAVKGGYDIPTWLGSYSTNVVASAGGFQGRFLKKEDEIPLRRNYNLTEVLSANSIVRLKSIDDISILYFPSDPIRLIRGNEWDWQTDESKEIFSNASFLITPQSNRMGFRMQGPELHKNSNHELISTAVSNGTIQMLPNGQLIILMSDHQTTGGYPRIGHVIASDIPTLAQKQVNTSISFRFTDIAESEEHFNKQKLYLLRLQKEFKNYLNEFFRQYNID